MVITRVIWGPPWPEFCMHLSFASTNIFLSPKVFVFNKIRQFLKFFGGHKNAKSSIYRAPYSYHGEYTALTVVEGLLGRPERRRGGERETVRESEQDAERGEASAERRERERKRAERKRR